jgi:hypothetical protein
MDLGFCHGPWILPWTCTLDSAMDLNLGFFLGPAPWILPWTWTLDFAMDLTLDSAMDLT